MANTFFFYTQALALEVGLSGQPDARLAASGGDTTYLGDSYNYQGRRFQIDEPISVDTGTTVTASLYIPGDWIDAYPGSAACSAIAVNSSSCARVAEFAVELAVDSNNARVPTMVARAGFDNRDPANAAVGPAPFLYITLDGPATLTSDWVQTATGLKGAMLVPGGNLKGLGWASNQNVLTVPTNLLRRNDWNQFSITVRRHDWDPMGWASRKCRETLTIEW